MIQALGLKKPADFRKAYREGKRYTSPHFALYRRRNGLSLIRTGIAIQKAHFKLATRRNRLRRVSKDAVKRDFMHACEGYDIVIASRKAPRELALKAILAELKTIIAKAGE